MQSTKGNRALLYRSNAPISIFKQEDAVSTSKRVRTLKVVKPEVEQPEPQPEEQVEVPHVDYDGQPLDEVQPQPQQPTEEVKLRKCPSHATWFPEEAVMRPMAEFPVSKTTGKLRGTYCRRCSSKQHTAYAQERRAVTRGPSLAEQLAEAQQQLADAHTQLLDAVAKIDQLEAELEAAKQTA